MPEGARRPRKNEGAWLGSAIRGAREAKHWSQDQLATRAKTTRQTISALENEGAGNIATLSRVVSALGLRELPLAGGRFTVVEANESGRTVQIAKVFQSIIDDARRGERLIGGPGDTGRGLAGGRVIEVADHPRLRITLADEEQQIEQLRAAFSSSPDAEFRQPFRGRGKHVVPRGIDVAAGHGAELLPRSEESEQLREIPEHYWDIGARMVLRARGESLIGRGIVDRDLLFIKPTPVPEPNRVIVCRLNEHAFAKVFDRRGEKARLLSANPSFSPIEIHEDDSFACFGIVVGRSGYVPTASWGDLISR